MEKKRKGEGFIIGDYDNLQLGGTIKWKHCLRILGEK